MKDLTPHITQCPIKDDTGLNDFQKLPNEWGIPIPRVGIERFRLPVNFLHEDGQILNHDTEASMFISLGADKTGVNMSRFCTIIQRELAQVPISYEKIHDLLIQYRRDLRDSPSEELISDSFLCLKFSYPLRQKSLKSDHWGWQYYRTEIKAHQNAQGITSFSLIVDYEYSSTCPCSLSMAKQYEKDYQKGLTQEGNGMATAHGQRSNARVEVKFTRENPISIEYLIKILRKAIPTETQSLVKRVDEQAFAILNGENPIFVEHVARKLSRFLDMEINITDWNAYIQHWESLHGHNAVSYIQKKRNEL